MLTLRSKLGPPAALLLTAALPAFFGFKGAGFIYPALFASAHAAHTVFFAGYRAPSGDLIPSLVFTLIFSTAVTAVSYAGGFLLARLAL